MEKKIGEIVGAQLKTAEKKLKAAKSLLKQNFIEDAISRAYYCIFHAASAVLISEGLNANSHSALKTLFGLHFIKTGKIAKKYARYLSHLKDERENGDYDIFVAFENKDAEKAVKETEEFLKAMKIYLKSK